MPIFEVVAGLLSGGDSDVFKLVAGLEQFASPNCTDGSSRTSFCIGNIGEMKALLDEGTLFIVVADFDVPCRCKEFRPDR